VTKMVSAREFNQQPSRISREAGEQPVIITDRGRPTRVLMSFEEYARISGLKRRMQLDLLLQPHDAADVEIDAELFNEPWRDGFRFD
jgi:prevent-host-death family protein